MTLHADVQPPKLAARMFQQSPIQSLKLGQQALGFFEQIIARWGQFELSPLFYPERRPNLLLQFADLVAERRLSQVQRLGRFGQGALFVDLIQNT